MPLRARRRRLRQSPVRRMPLLARRMQVYEVGPVPEAGHLLLERTI